MSTRAKPTEVEVVAAVLWGEARGEGPQGIRAVAEVIGNRRYRTDVFHAPSLGAVVTQPKQFACLNDTSPEKLIAKARSSFGPDQAAWRYCLAVARQLQRGTHTGNLTNGATHFCCHYAHWQRGMEFCAKVGRHSFYR